MLPGFGVFALALALVVWLALCFAARGVLQRRRS
jgi:hypothetical protein